MNAPLSSSRLAATRPVQAPCPRVSRRVDARLPNRLRPAEPVQQHDPLANGCMADLNHFRPAVDDRGMEARDGSPRPEGEAS
jgi:hypothetical protein